MLFGFFYLCRTEDVFTIKFILNIRATLSVALNRIYFAPIYYRLKKQKVEELLPQSIGEYRI